MQGFRVHPALALIGAVPHNRPMNANDTKPISLLIFSDFV
jgi:hypothetical protein